MIGDESEEGAWFVDSGERGDWSDGEEEEESEEEHEVTDNEEAEEILGNAFERLLASSKGVGAFDNVQCPFQQGPDPSLVEKGTKLQQKTDARDTRSIKCSQHLVHRQQ